MAPLYLAASAYQASIALDDEAIYVLTPNALHRFVGSGSSETIPLALGFGAAMLRDGIIFWSAGAVWKIPKHGGDPQRMGTVRSQPQTLVASLDHFAWIEVSDLEGFSIRTLRAGTARVVYASPGRIDAATMLGDVVFFAEQVTASRWHIGRVGVNGGGASFSPEKPGQPPTQLSGFANRIFFQDRAATDALIEMSPDLEEVQVLALNRKCSPFAVWQSVFCADTGGLFELDAAGPPRVLATGDAEGITAVAANAERVVWLSDAGPDQLMVEALTRTGHE